jgi:GNAT superfamily N-acetyltransferase
VTIRIRRARRADAATLTAIAHAAKRHWRYPERSIRLWAADLTVTSELIARDAVYCAVHADRVVGFYAVSGKGRTRELEHMWVAPRHIGKGVGRRLFAHLRRRLRAERASRLRIASDPNAEPFYLRMGATRVGTVPTRPHPRRLPLLELREAPRKARRY